MPHHQRAHIEFEKVTRDEVVGAVPNMKVLGFSDHSIAVATRLGVEAVRRLLIERRKARE